MSGRAGLVTAALACVVLAAAPAACGDDPADDPGGPAPVTTVGAGTPQDSNFPDGGATP